MQPSQPCLDCNKSSVIQEALFNRIQILETQVAKASAEKDAAQQSLFRLIDVQAIARFQGIETPPSSLKFDSSPDGSPIDSLTSSSRTNLAQCLEQASSTNDDDALVDLLGPIEQQLVKSSKDTVDSSATKKHRESDVRPNNEEYLASATPICSFAIDDHNVVPYVHHFVRKTLEPRSDAVHGGQATIVVGPIPEGRFCAKNAPMVASSELDKCTIPAHRATYSSSLEEDSEDSRVRSGIASMTTSLSSSGSQIPELLPSQQNHADSALGKNGCIALEQVIKTEPKVELSVETEYSKWSSAYQGPQSSPNILSPEERWEKYCDKIFIRGPKRSCNELQEPARVDVDDAVIVDEEGQAAELNRFRYRNTCGLCFNPQDSEQGVYRTVVVSKLPKNATMTDLLDKIKGGAIYDAKMLDTHAITGYKSALLTFMEGSQAMDFEEHALYHPLSIAGQVIEVSLVEVPTRPISSQLAFEISKNQCTRCLYVHRFPRHIPPQQLRLDLRPDPVCKIDFIECMGMSADSILELRFLSVVAAMKAFHVLKSIARYRKCDVEYGQDICAEPWETPKLVKVVEDGVPHPDINKDTEDGSLDTGAKA